MTVINTNVKALTAQGSLSNVNNKLSQAMERLSTGLRINSSKDDAAGLAITNKMTSDIRGLAVAIRNANDGLSLAQTAEGAIAQINDMLQRMRELAVQSSNGTASDISRKASQQEVDQLKQEINNIAGRTSFNGIKLLDGSAAKLQLQTGVDRGQVIDLNIEAMNTNTIGVGSRPSLSAVGMTGVETDDSAGSDTIKQIAAGDLIINGVTVGASQSSADNLSAYFKAESGLAKAAAINAVSAQTGVKAVVGETYVGGVSMDPAGGAGVTITINGVDTAEITTTADSGQNRALTVSAINAISDRTGVVAFDSGDPANGVTLKAVDGRNISIALSAPTDAAEVGLAEGTTTAGYSLISTNGLPINISANNNGDISTAGLSLGTFSPTRSTVASGSRGVVTVDGLANGLAADADADTVGEIAGVLTAGTMLINGVSIAASDPSADTASYDNAGTSLKSASSISIAAAINKSTARTGVTAVVNANVVKGSDFDASQLATDIGAGTVTMTINGVDIAFNDATASMGDMVIQINAHTGETGVVATDNGKGMTLTAADGRNITIAIDGATDEKSIGIDVSYLDPNDIADEATSYGTFTLVSDKAFEMKAGPEGNAFFTQLGLKQGVMGGEANGFKIADVDISSQDGAQAALTAIDAALEAVNLSQAKLGAYQNRLDSSISNLSEVSRNMTASRSRIMDTDYATETTNLAKSQIIQQAATAMLAQANQSAQSVLSLLK